jgi:acyl dehydratase
VIRVSRPTDLLGRDGTDLGVSPWIRVDQPLVDSFAAVTGDRQFIHVDPVRAAATPFGGTIAHGLLVLSVVLPAVAGLLQVDHLASGVNYGFDKVRFTAPVRVGADLRGRAVLGEVRAVDGGVQCRLDVTAEVRDSDRPVCVAANVLRLLGGTTR